MQSLKSHFPRIGMRIIKSTFAVGACIFIYQLTGMEGLPFFLVIAALQSLQPYQRDVKEIAVRNVFGTLLAGACALLVMEIQRFVLEPAGASDTWYYIMITLGVAVALYSAVVLGHGDAAYFTAVVYLCVIMVHMDNESSFLYVMQRLVETLCGIAIGMGVNAIRVPRKKIRDTLFVAALDDVLHSEYSILPEYSKVELNRILDDGVRLSIITQHSSASFWEAAGSIRFKMPVILLDGAVLYDPEEKRYLFKVELDNEEARHITEAILDPDISIFQTAIIDDSVINFCRHIAPDTLELFEQMRRSNYRNYIYRPMIEGIPIIYLFCMGTEEKLDEACAKLKELGLDKQCKIMRYKFPDREGMGYMRIYSSKADRKAMLEQLRLVCGMEKLRSFGNDPEMYDVCVKTAEGESILKALKDEAEPFIWW